LVNRTVEQSVLHPVGITTRKEEAREAGRCAFSLPGLKAGVSRAKTDETSDFLSFGPVCLSGSRLHGNYKQDLVEYT